MTPTSQHPRTGQRALFGQRTRFGARLLRWLCLAAMVVLPHGCASLPAIDPSGEQIFLPAPAATVQPAYAAPPDNSVGFFRTSFFGGGFWDLEPEYEEPCPLPYEGECNEPEVYGWEPHPLLNHPGLLQDRLWQREPVMGNPLTRAPGGPPIAPPQPMGPPYTIAVPATPQDATVATGGRPGRVHHAALQLTPQRLVAPVGQAVVLRAGVCGIDGYLITEQPIEWSLSTDSVGSIVEVDQTDKRAWRFWNHAPKKVSGQYAVGRTSTETQLLPRGTIGVNDDVWLLRGQTWASVTSASEGATHVTAVAPSVAGWNERSKTATIHWVDGQWSFPPPSVSQSATGQTLVTKVSRATSNAPIENWIVRYEIASGTPAALDTSGAQVQEVRTNNNGEAAVTVLPQGDFSGVTNINMQIIRTGVNPGDLARLPVGQGSTTVTWGADAPVLPNQPPSLPSDQAPSLPPGQAPSLPGQPPSLPQTPAAATVQVTGPATASVDSTVTYRIRLDNLGNAPINSVEVTTDAPSQLRFESSSPAPDNATGQRRWQVGPLAPGQPKQITVNYRVTGEGALQVCASANIGNAVPAADCVTTVVTPASAGPGMPGPGPSAGPASLALRIVGPSTGTIGGSATYELQVTNNSNRVVDIPKIEVAFDDGLQHISGRSPIVANDFGLLQPRETRAYPLGFTTRAAGQHCFEVTAVDDTGGRTSQRYCVTVTAPAQPPVVTPPPPSGGLSVQMTGPSVVNVNEPFEFSIVITNLTGANLNDVRVVNGSDLALEPQGVLPQAESYDQNINQLEWRIPFLAVGQSQTLRVGFVSANPLERACSNTTAQAGTITGSNEACVRVVSPSAPPPINSPAPELRGQERPDAFTPSGPAPNLGPPSSDGTLDLRSALDVHVRPGIANQQQEQDFFFEITNASREARHNVVLTTLLPKEATLVEAEGQPGIARSSPDGAELQFNPIRTLRANEQVSIKVRLYTRGKALPNPLVRVHSEQDPPRVP